MLATGTALLLVAGMAAAGGQIAGGVTANKSSQQQADLQEEQARITLEESDRAAEQKVTERRKFLAEQRMAYLANGVSLSGTPGIVQGDTFKEFQMEIDALRKSGVAQFGFGMKSAAITRATGRAQLLSGIMSGVGTAATTAYTANKLSTPAKASSQSEILGFDTRRFR